MKKTILVLVMCFAVLISAQSQNKIDLQKSVVKWKGSNLFKFNEHSGTVNFISGSITNKGNRLIGSEFLIDMRTIINSDGKYNEMLVNHLKGVDFFNVEAYPISTLKITKVFNKGNNVFYVFADLTIKDVKNIVRFNATITNFEGKKVLTTKFIIDRTLWGVIYKTKGVFATFKDDVISEAIEFEVHIEWINDDKC